MQLYLDVRTTTANINREYTFFINPTNSYRSNILTFTPH